MVTAARRIFGRENFFERLPEFCVEYGVNDWVEGGIRIAEPCEDFERKICEKSFTLNSMVTYIIRVV